MILYEVNQRKLIINNNEIKLSKREGKILEILANSNFNTAAEIYKYLYNSNEIKEPVIRKLVYNIRCKTKLDIISHYGIGYKLKEEVLISY
jgi:DNA-binding response OmpR family regulator